MKLTQSGLFHHLPGLESAFFELLLSSFTQIPFFINRFLHLRLICLAFGLLLFDKPLQGVLTLFLSHRNICVQISFVLLVPLSILLHLLLLITYPFLSLTNQPGTFIEFLSALLSLLLVLFFTLSLLDAQHFAEQIRAVQLLGSRLQSLQQIFRVRNLLFPDLLISFLQLLETSLTCRRKSQSFCSLIDCLIDLPSSRFSVSTSFRSTFFRVEIFSTVFSQLRVIACEPSRKYRSYSTSASSTGFSNCPRGPFNRTHSSLVNTKALPRFNGRVSVD